MRSIIVVVCCLAVALLTPVSVEAKTCDSICETTDLWGISGAASGFKSCACSDSTTGAERTGPDCGCGVCYLRSGSRIIGQARVNGECPSGTTACDDCEIAASSGSTNTSTTTTKTPTSTTTSPATTVPTTSLTPSSTSTTSGTSGDSASATGNNESLNVTSSPTTTVPAASNVTASVNSSRGSVAGAADLPGGKLGSPSNSSGSGSTSSSGSSSSGLATWQIALIICSAILVIAVVMITITSCYCKARNRMKDNELIEEDTREYEHYWHPGRDDDDRAGSGNQLANSGFGTLMQGGRSSFNSNHSRPNSAKNVQYEPTYPVDERIGAGRSHRGSLGSNADLPGIYQPFPQRERQSQDVGSRKNISIEL